MRQLRKLQKRDIREQDQLKAQSKKETNQMQQSYQNELNAALKQQEARKNKIKRRHQGENDNIVKNHNNARRILKRNHRDSERLLDRNSQDLIKTKLSEFKNQEKNLFKEEKNHLKSSKDIGKKKLKLRALEFKRNSAEKEARFHKKLILDALFELHNQKRKEQEEDYSLQTKHYEESYQLVRRQQRELHKHALQSETEKQQLEQNFLKLKCSTELKQKQEHHKIVYYQLLRQHQLNKDNNVQLFQIDQKQAWKEHEKKKQEVSLHFKKQQIEYGKRLKKEIGPKEVKNRLLKQKADFKMSLAEKDKEFNEYHKQKFEEEAKMLKEHQDQEQLDLAEQQQQEREALEKDHQAQTEQQIEAHKKQILSIEIQYYESLSQRITSFQDKRLNVLHSQYLKTRRDLLLNHHAQQKSVLESHHNELRELYSSQSRSPEELRTLESDFVIEKQELAHRQEREIKEFDEYDSRSVQELRLQLKKDLTLITQEIPPHVGITVDDTYLGLNSEFDNKDKSGKRKQMGKKHSRVSGKRKSTSKIERVVSPASPLETSQAGLSSSEPVDNSISVENQ